MSELLRNAKKSKELIVLNIIGSVALVLGWLTIAIMGQVFFEALAQTSSTVASFEGRYEQLIAILLAPSLMGIFVANYLYLQRPFWFFLLIVLAFTFAEAFIPIVHEVALLIRYLLMVSLVIYGILNIGIVFNRSTWVHKLSLFMIIWVLLHVLYEGVNAANLTMLPIQLTMYLGLMYGISGSIASDSKIYQVLKSLAWAGVVATFVHISALLIYSEAFLGGRFRSYYLLPTNFANNFVILVISMLWYAMCQKIVSMKLAFLAFVVVGIYILLLSGTRNALLAVLVAACILTFFWQRKYAIYILVAAVVGGLLLIGFGIGESGIGDASGRLTSVSEKETRFAVWERAIGYIANKPLWGYGLNANMALLDSRLPEWMQFDAHSAYLGLWVRLGVFGVACVILIYLWCGVYGLKLLSSKVPQVEKNLTILPVALLGVLFVAGFFEENLSGKGSIQQFSMALSVGLLLTIRKLKYHKNYE